MQVVPPGDVRVRVAGQEPGLLDAYAALVDEVDHGRSPKVVLELQPPVGGTASMYGGIKGFPRPARLSPKQLRLMWGLRVLSWVPIGFYALLSLARSGGITMEHSLRDRLIIGTFIFPMVAAEWIRAGGMPDETPKPGSR